MNEMTETIIKATLATAQVKANLAALNVGAVQAAQNLKKLAIALRAELAKRERT